MDCAQSVPKQVADDTLVLVVLLPPEQLMRTQTAFLQKLSAILRTALRFQLDHNGEAMIRPYTRGNYRIKRELQPPQDEVIGSVVYLEIDIRLCPEEMEDCIKSAENAADLLGALSAVDMLPFPYPIKQVSVEKRKPDGELPQWVKLMMVGSASLFLLVILVIGMLIARRKREHSTLWFPEGFFPKKEPSSNKNRREPVDCLL